MSLPGIATGVRVYAPELSERQREIFIEVELRERQLSEVAKDLDVHRGTVYRHLERARKKIYGES